MIADAAPDCGSEGMALAEVTLEVGVLAEIMLV